MVFPPIHWFMGLGGEELTDIVEYPMYASTTTTEASNNFPARRFLKIVDTDTVVHMRKRVITTSSSISLHRYDTNANYTFPNKTVKFFVVILNELTVLSPDIFTSTTADTADGTNQETLTSLVASSLTTSSIIEGNFNGKFLTIRNPSGVGNFDVVSAVVVESA